MGKKLLKELITISFIDGNLDEAVVTVIAQKLKRSDFKQYIQGLKKKLKELTVSIQSPFPPSQQDIKNFQSFFLGKKIVTSINKKLLLGIAIADNDMVYDFTLNSKLDSIVKFIKNYD